MNPLKSEIEDTLELRIGFLRQWLNEDRITDYERLITNEDILHWLQPGIDNAIHQAERKARIDELHKVDAINMYEVADYTYERLKELEGDN